MWYLGWALSICVAVGLSIWSAVRLEKNKDSAFFSFDEAQKDPPQKDQY